MHEQPANHIEKDHHFRIRKVLAYIQENLSVDVPLAKMAEIANFSPFHFQKLFTQYVGESPKQYVLRLRIERIAHNLKLYPEL
jgi:AraC family transcriptional regulator